MPPQCVVLHVRYRGTLGSCSPVCPRGLLCCVCAVLGHLAPVHRCACSVCCVACAVSWASWLLFTGVLARCVALHVRCPQPLGSCSLVCPRGLLCCMCGVLGPLAPVQPLPARFVVLLVRCPGQLGSCSPVCPLRALPVCAVFWAPGLPFTGVPAWCSVLLVRCPGPLASCSPVCLLGALCCVCGVLGHLAPVHRCARSVCCVVCAVTWATWLLFTGVPARCVVLRVRCPGPLGSCSPVCLLCVVCCACAVLGLLAPVHRCARLVCCAACTVSWSPWLLFTGALALCAVHCPGPLRSCSPVCLLGVLCCGVRVRGFSAGRTLVHPDGGFL